MNSTAKEKIGCIICGSEERVPLYSNDTVSYALCPQCALVFLFPRPTAEEYDAFYKGDYQQHRHAITTYEQAIAIRKIKGLLGKRSYLSNLDRFLHERSRVLEIGCGWGTFLKLVHDTYGASVEGIEPGELQAQVAREYYGLPVASTTLDEYASQYRGEQFDLVVMMHVLEHLPDPRTALSRVVDLLSPRGVLFIAVPNLAKPNEPLDRFFHFEHCYYFTPYTLSELLSRQGFKLLSIDTEYSDIRIIAVRKENPLPSIAVSHLKEKYNARRIHAILRRQKMKYAFLRILKNSASAVLPDTLFASLRKRTVELLKRLGVIDI